MCQLASTPRETADITSQLSAAFPSACCLLAAVGGPVNMNKGIVSSNKYKVTRQ